MIDKELNPNMQNSTKSTMSAPALSGVHNFLFERKKIAREKVIQEWLCIEHLLPDDWPPVGVIRIVQVSVFH